MNKFYQSLASFFSRFLKFFPASLTERVGADKIFHFVAGLMLSLIAVVAVVVYSLPALTIIFVALAAGVIKELLDLILNLVSKKKTHGVSLADTIATVLPGIIVYFVFMLFVI